MSRDEARQAIWTEGTFVDFDASLNVAMTKLRRALHDSSGTPRLVETIPKRGYRFLAEVRPNGHPAPEGPMPSPTSGAGCGGGEVEAKGSRRDRCRPAFRRLLRRVGQAVLRRCRPVWHRNCSKRGRVAIPTGLVKRWTGPLEPGIPADVLLRLERWRGIAVAPLASVQRFGADNDPLTVGRALGVDAVLEGRMRRDGNFLLLTARLLRVSDGKQLWSDVWHTPWTHIFDVQNGSNRGESAAEQGRDVGPGPARFDRRQPVR